MKFIFVCFLFLISCNASKPGFSPISGIVRNSPQAEVDVIVSGLGTSPLSLSLNDESFLLARTDGTYLFDKKINKNSEFKVSIAFDPTDRNCQVFHPNNTVISSKETVRINCTAVGNNYFSGFVQGHTGTLQLQKGTEIISITTSMNQYVFETPGSVSELITMIEPAGQDCYFSRNNLSSLSPTPANDLNIYCVKELGSTYSIILNVTGLTGTLQVRHASSTKAPFTHFLSGTGGYIANSQAYANQRQIMEIIDAPNDQRCFFNETGNHLYSMNLSTPQDTTIQATCLPRATCEYGGLEFFGTNGLIKDALCHDDKLYLGGTFTLVGRQLGLQKLRLLSNGSGLSSNEITFFDRIHGRIRSVVQDGKGGFFVGGSFNQVGDKKIQNLVRLDKNFVIDESFKWQVNGNITKLKLEDNELFLFGGFTTIYTEGKSYTRNGFAKLVLGAGSPKLSPLQLPEALTAKISSADIIDSKIYIYGRFLENSASKHFSFQMNRYSGKAQWNPNALDDSSNTLFWKEPLTGKVWIINKDFGLADPLTLAAHPQDTGHASVPKNLQYVLDNANRLHLIAGTTLKYINLNDLYSGAQGPPPQNYPMSVTNMRAGFSVGDNVCFTPTNHVNNMTYGASSRTGLACFDSFQNLLAANPGMRLNPDSIISFPSGSDTSLVIAAPFFGTTPARGLVSFGVNEPGVVLAPGDLASGKVNTLAHDGTYLYYGGDFTTSSSNVNLQRSNAFGVDSSWNFGNTISGEVVSMAISSNNLFVSNRTSLKRFFGLDLTNDVSQIQVATNTFAAPSKVLSVSGTVATLEAGVLNFRELHTLAAGAAPLNSVPSQVSVTSDGSRYINLASPDLVEFRDTDGSLEYDFALSSFDETSTEILVNNNGFCLYLASGELRCYDPGTGFQVLNKTYEPGSHILKKGIENFYFFDRFLGAPEILIP